MLNLFFTKALAAAENDLFFSSNPDRFGTSNSSGRISNFSQFVDRLTSGVFQPLIYLSFVAGLAYFLYGVLKYLRKSSDETEREEGRQMMLYGIIALFVMVSVWGLVGVVAGTFNLDNVALPLPTFR